MELENINGIIAHTQMPNKMTEKQILKPKDCLVYLAIKSHLNQKTKICNPGLSRLMKITKASINTIKKSIRALMDEGYIDRTQYGNGYNYTFQPYLKFEPFTYDFLYNNTLDFREKSYLASVLQYMKITEDNIGKILFTNFELSERLNISYDTLIRIEECLIRKGILAKIHSNSSDQYGGERIERIYNLEAIGQGLVYRIKHIEERVDNNEKDVVVLKKEITTLKAEIKKLKEQKFIDNQSMLILKDKLHTIIL